MQVQGAVVQSQDTNLQKLLYRLLVQGKAIARCSDAEDGVTCSL